MGRRLGIPHYPQVLRQCENAGAIFGRQVELLPPADILEFVLDFCHSSQLVVPLSIECPGDSSIIGLARHKEKTYEGEHEAIIDRKLWDEVQRTLEQNQLGVKS